MKKNVRVVFNDEGGDEWEEIDQYKILGDCQTGYLEMFRHCDSTIIVPMNHIKLIVVKVVK